MQLHLQLMIKMQNFFIWIKFLKFSILKNSRDVLALLYPDTWAKLNQ